MFNYKLILFLLCLCFLTFHSSYSIGETIHLKTAKNGVPVVSFENRSGYVYATILKDDINFVYIVYSDGNKDTDNISLKNGDKITCKIVRVFENTVLARFSEIMIKAPRSNNNYYDNSNNNYNNNHGQQETKQSYNNYAKKKPRKFIGMETDGDDDLDLVLLEDLENESSSYNEVSKSKAKSNTKNDIKNKLLSEIRNSKNKSSNNNQSNSGTGSFDLLDKTLGSQSAPPARNETNNKPIFNEPQSFDFSNSSMGKVKGRFLQNGRGLNSCKVRLVKLRKEGTTYYKDENSREKLESFTDNNGVYNFNNISPGLYKLYWKPQSESSWIRRVSMEPDVLVKAGDVAIIEELETNQRILN